LVQFASSVAEKIEVVSICLRSAARSRNRRYGVTNTLLNGTIPDPLRPSLPLDLGFATPPQNCNRYYLRNGQSYRLQIWPTHSQGPSEHKHMKNVGEKGAWAYPGTVQFFEYLPIISGTRKATNFKFGRYIQRVHPNKRPSKFGRKGSVGVSRDCPIFSVPPIILGTGKATNFKFGTLIHRVDANKSPLQIWKKRERGRIQGLPYFFQYPLLSQERVKLRTSNFVRILLVSIGTKTLYKFGEK